MIKPTLMISFILKEIISSQSCGLHNMFPSSYELDQKNFMSYSFEFKDEQFQQVTVFGWMKVT